MFNMQRREEKGVHTEIEHLQIKSNYPEQLSKICCCFSDGNIQKN